MNAHEEMINAGTYLATKFVRSVLGSASESVPPTICFTSPLCRSMQGRKRERFRDGGAGDMMGVLGAQELGGSIARSLPVEKA